MKWMGMYLFGYALLLVAVLLTLWKTGLLARVEPFWLGVGLLIAVGIGVLLSVASGGRKQTIEVDHD